MAADPLIGREFAGYRIEEQIGRGGMGVVYRAEHLLLGRYDALKLLAQDLSADAEFRERFLRESRMAAGMDHPNVIPIHHAGEVDERLYIAMRYVQGADLRSVLTSRGRLDAEQTVSIIDQVSSALDAAHSRGLVHRDVKPANILIGTDGHVYLTDFGIAKHTRTRGGLTKTGSFLGTLDYAAPEQIEGKQLDGRADVYALGCVVYQCLTGALPYEKDSEVQMIYAHLLETPPPPTTKHPGLPGGVDAVIENALAKSRDHRFPSCGELASALRTELTGGQAIGAGAARTAAAATQAAPEAPARPPAAPPPPPPAPPPPTPGRPAEPPRGPAPAAPPLWRRTPVLLGAGAVVLLLAIAIPAVLIAGGNSNSFPNAEEQQLLDLIPAAIRPTCARLTAPAAAAGVSCNAGGRPSVAYYRFRSANAMNRFYTARLPAGYVRGRGSCVGPPLIGERPYTVAGKTAGRVVCVLAAAGGSATIGWTAEQTKIYARALRLDGSQRALYRWWASSAGPLASAKAKSPPKRATTAGTILFADTFANRAVGWAEDDDVNVSRGVSGGSYRMRLKRGAITAPSTTRPLQPPLFFGNAEVRVDARRLSGSGTYFFGVICRSPSSRVFYRFEVRNDGVLFISRETRTQTKTLKHSPKPARLLRTNRIRASCVGSARGPLRLALNVNGMTLSVRVRRPLAGAGAVGMLASTGPKGRVEVAFDNFSVRRR